MDLNVTNATAQEWQCTIAGCVLDLSELIQMERIAMKFTARQWNYWNKKKGGDFMPDSADRESVKIRNELLASLKRLYDSANREIQAEIEELLIAIYLDDEEATQRQRIQHAERNGLNEIVKIFITYVLIAGNSATKKISEKASKIYDLNYKYIQEIANEQKIAIDSEHEPDPKSEKAIYRNLKFKYAQKDIKKRIKREIKKGKTAKEISIIIAVMLRRYYNSAVLTANREILLAQNSARIDSAEKIYKQTGKEYKKYWIYTWLSHERRHWHIAMNGETRNPNEPFSNGLQYPGEWGAPAVEIANCKCAMGIEFKD